MFCEVEGWFGSGSRSTKGKGSSGKGRGSSDLDREVGVRLVRVEGVEVSSDRSSGR